jgi:hypothetical protein
MAPEEKCVRRVLSAFVALASAKRCEERLELIKLLISPLFERVQPLKLLLGQERGHDAHMDVRALEPLMNRYLLGDVRG